MNCEICKEYCDNYRKLSKHIRDRHKGISIKEYYDIYKKEENEGICPICKIQTNFESISIGYHTICGSRKCSGLYHRNKLKNDPIKFSKFKQKVKKNVTKMWKTMTDEEKILRVNNSKKMQSFSISLLSEEEKKIKFGWMNNLSKEEKDIKCKEILEKSLFKWWNNASPEAKENVFKKRIATKIKKGICIPESQANDYCSYRERVRRLTNKNYRIYKNFINPQNIQRSKNFQLDHKLSIFHGFMFGIPEEIIASPYNLELLEGYKNNQKHIKNSISFEELWKNIEKASLLQ